MTNRTPIDYLVRIMLAGVFAVLLQACGSDVGGNEDDIRPVAALTSLNDGEEVVGTWMITWDTREANRSTVDLYISSDSGSVWTLMKSSLPDTGSFAWDSNEVEDCRSCRMRVVPKDVVGNVGAPVDSARDFIVNNIPQVLGIAFYRDVGNDGPGDGDEMRVPFDKELELRTSIASDIFTFPVLGDSVGSFAEISRSPSNPRELLITMNDLSSFGFHLHVRGVFDPDRLGRTAPSGINLLTNISEGVIFAPDTGRTADAAESGIDIVPTFNDSGQPLLVPANFRVSGVALGDVDGDGDLDLVQGYFDLYDSRSDDEPNRVWLNGGDSSGSNTGVFMDSGQTLGSNSTNAIALGDVDGDGDLDLVTGNDGANLVWLNGGDNSGINNGPLPAGEFSDSSQALGTNTTNAIVLGDVDGDGDLDLITGNDGANLVWLNGEGGDNTGIFSPGPALVGDNDNNTSSIALGDVDGDGDLDLVAGNSGSNRVWLNGGDSTGSNTGVFGDSNQMLGNSGTAAIALGDVDGDGDLDVDGDGICDVDLDEDGDCTLDLDLVVGNFGDNRVWLNGGDSTGSSTGVFSDSGQALSDNNSTRAIALGDVDGDGDLDLVAGDYREPNRAYINDGSGTFTDSGQDLGNNQTYAITLGDVDGDGDIDLAANNLYLNSLASTELFIESNQLGFFGLILESPALGDIDGDGDLDLVTAIQGLPAPDRVFVNNGSGIFTDSGQLLGDRGTTKVVLADIDGDGDLDLVTNDPTTSVWLNGGDNLGSNTGVFSNSRSISYGRTRTFALGDVDGDGDLDLVTGNIGANRVWLNGGDDSGSNTGVFEVGPVFVGDNDSDTFAIILGDVDGDGDLDVDGDGICDIDLDEDGDCNLDLDLVTGNLTNEPNRVWLNGGDNSGSNTGVFTDSGQALSTNNLTFAVSLGDVDGDGDLDLVEGNSGPNRVWWNNENNMVGQEGVFSDSGQQIGNGARAIGLEDVDGDGDLDLVSGNARGPNQVWLNRGHRNGSNTATFSMFDQSLGNNDTLSIAFGDIDGDGDRDHIEASFELGSGKLTIWLNDF